MANFRAPCQKQRYICSHWSTRTLRIWANNFSSQPRKRRGVRYGPPVLAMGICYGGLAQLIAGIMEWKKGNNFTSVAFISFATFWWSFVSIHAIPSLGWLNAEGYESSLHTSMGWYLILWFVFTFIMFIASFTKPWAIQVVFGTLCLLFILLAAHNFAEHENTLKAAGVIGMICAFSAIYSGAAEIINGAWLITILPLGAPGEKWLGKISAE